MRADSSITERKKAAGRGRTNEMQGANEVRGTAAKRLDSQSVCYWTILTGEWLEGVVVSPFDGRATCRDILNRQACAEAVGLEPVELT